MRPHALILVPLPLLFACSSLPPRVATPSPASPPPADRPWPAAAGLARAAEEEASEHRTHYLSLLVGGRSLDEDWEPVEDQVVVGLEYAMSPLEGPVGFELGASFSQDDDELFLPGLGTFDAEAEVRELSGGVRKTFLLERSPARPYVGAGLAWIDVEADVEGFSSDDQSLAGYLHAGIVWHVRSIHVGVDVRYLFGSDIDIEGVDLDADYAQATAVVGWSF